MATRVIDELLLRGLDDWLQMAEVVSVVGSADPALPNAEKKVRALGVVTKMLDGGLVEAGDVTSDGFVSWRLSPRMAIDTIVERWSRLEDMPGIGEVCWLANTEAGAAAAKTVVTSPPFRTTRRSAPLVSGTVVENTAGAEYEGVVFDRWLIVRLADGQRIDVFDPGPPIGEPLIPGTHAEFALVAAIPTRVRIDRTGEPDRLWQGEVVHTAWRAAPDTLEVLRPELTEFPWVVVGTPIGGLLLSPTDLPDGVREGAFVSWDGRRLDLFGFTRTEP
jgi:hypothetical protein